MKQRDVGGWPVGRRVDRWSEYAAWRVLQCLFNGRCEVPISTAGVLFIGWLAVAVAALMIILPDGAVGR